MSRHGYTYDVWDAEEQARANIYRGAVNSAIRGVRGQALLRDLAQALDAMPDKRLVESNFIDDERGVCALGALACMRRYDLKDLQQYGVEEEDASYVASQFGVAEALVREIMFLNDAEAPDVPEERWRYMREWVRRKLA